MATILVIDDDKDVRDFLRRALEDDGHVVVEADNGNHGLEQFRRHVADLVITDILMPEMEGIETILELRRHYRAVKIIGISGGGRTGTMDFLDAAEKMGADSVLHKPFRASTLIDVVSKVLGTHDSGGDTPRPS